MNIGQNAQRNGIDDERLERCLRLAPSRVSPDMHIFVTNKQCQFSQGSFFLLGQWSTVHKQMQDKEQM
jgi:hypothetical protein